MNYDNGSQRVHQYSRMFSDGSQSRESHWFCPRPRIKRALQEGHLFSSNYPWKLNALLLENLLRKNKLGKKAKLLNSCPLASELGMRWLLRTKKGKRISTDQTCITEPNLGLLVHHTAEPIYWHQVAVKKCTEFIAGRHARRMTVLKRHTLPTGFQEGF